MGAARVDRVGAIQLAYYHRVDTPKRRICRSALREQLISRASLRAAEIHVPRAARAAAAPGGSPGDGGDEGGDGWNGLAATRPTRALAYRQAF